MLQKTAEHIFNMKSAQSELTKELDDYKNEIELLSDQISDLQNELPEHGVSILGGSSGGNGGNINNLEKFRQKFNAYVQERTVENWKFYIFSTIMKPMFENYIQNVNTDSKEELENSVLEWHSQYCNLSQLRPRKKLFKMAKKRVVLIIFIYF
jgi:MAX-like protein X